MKVRIRSTRDKERVIIVSRPPRSNPRPFVWVNMAMTADGKTASSNRALSSFGSGRDRRRMFELRSRADAIICGARTADLEPVTLGSGPRRYRNARRRRGLAGNPIRILVSGAGSLDSGARVFDRRFSPILVVTTQRAARARLRKLSRVASQVLIAGRSKIDFASLLRWLWKEWGVRRIVAEGGGRLNGALFASDLVDEVRVTLCPFLAGGRDSATVADGDKSLPLGDRPGWRRVSVRRSDGEYFLVFRRDRGR